MKRYNVWFQDGHIMMSILARNNQEARKEFNRCIKIKEDKLSEAKE